MTEAFYVSYALLWAVVALQTFLLLGMLRTLYTLQQQGVAAPPPPGGKEHLAGHPVPAFTATDLAGERVDSDEVSRQLTALLFVSPECGTCAVTLDELEQLQVKAEGNVVVICRSDAASCRRLVDEHGLTSVRVVVDEDERVSELLGIDGVPTAVLVNEGHVLTYGQPMRGDELEEMMASEANGDHGGERADGGAQAPGGAA
ncbi:MAG TPA: redoxin family protein [Solirubrobacteraceae bacterium]|jgi:peroxiredoxin|nr:redoxin family protein [Solirubrobacteraceae bacterium]